MRNHARLLLFLTIALILAGGLVKSTESGLSDPTWPHFNGAYQPRLHGPTLFEHSHRLIAGTVALITVALAIRSIRSERRAWVRRLAALAAFAVLLQATLGGLTVLLKLKS